MGQRLTLAVQGKMDVVKINGYDDDDDDDESSYSLAIGKSFILTYVLTVFSMYSFICVVIFIKLIDHEFRKNVLRKLATRYFFSLTDCVMELFITGF